VTPAALGDGDPASDYLLGRQTFVSPNASVASSDKVQLDALVTASRLHGYTIRIAIIQSRYDLGAVTMLDNKPRLYAHFLSEELRFVYKKRLLVVMPNGYGVANNGKSDPTEQAVLDKLSPPDRWTARRSSLRRLPRCALSRGMQASASRETPRPHPETQQDAIAS
jgi:hypothetical protein